MSENKVCWKCGASIEDLPFPLSRRAVCESCHAELHVCKLCKFYDTTRANQCQEPIAEPVRDKQKSNFCEYFQVKSAAYQVQDHTQADAARHQLAALFGGQAADLPKGDDPDGARSELEKLFGINNGDSDKNNETE